MWSPPDELLGLIVAPDPDPDVPHGTWRVYDTRSPDLVLGRGPHPYCLRLRLAALEERIGGGPGNLPLRTMGGKQFWADVFAYAGWRIQENVLGGHCRLLDESDRRRAWGTYEECRVAFEEHRLEKGLRRRSGHAVVLLHGLIRAKDSMRALARRFHEAGYEVIDVNYPSTRRSIQDHADQVRLLLNRSEQIETVSFVTHSLGAIVARATLALSSQQHDRWIGRTKVHRMVMIFPPNRGALKADKWRNSALAQVVMGPVLHELGRGAPEQPPPDCPFAIIAGSRDTTVAFHEAWLPGAEEIRILDVDHTFGMNDPAVVEAALGYLDHGSLEA